VNSARDKWEAFLDPDVLRGKLISASIYIAAYEMLKESIVGRIRNFYSTGFTETVPQFPLSTKEMCCPAIVARCTHHSCGCWRTTRSTTRIS
jgi:hypothetical protein